MLHSCRLRLVPLLKFVALGSVFCFLAIQMAQYSRLIGELKPYHTFADVAGVNDIRSDSIHITSIFGLRSLFHHEVPLCPFRLWSVTVVISHCRHPLHWVTDFVNGFEALIDQIWVFTKCGENVIGAPQGSNITKLPNIGGCDHTFAHAIQMYADLPINSPDDTIIFLKDTQPLDSHIFEDLLRRAEFYGCGCLLKDKIWAIHEFDVLRTWNFGGASSYSRGNGEIETTESPASFLNENFHNLGEWIDNLSLPIYPTQNLVTVCYTGIFATTKGQISKKPIWVWEAILKSLSRGNNIIEGHYAERTWAALLSKPLSNTTASKIWEATKNNPRGHDGSLQLN